MEPLNPYRPPVADSSAAPKKLGSLAQSAHGKELKQARNILIIIGVLTFALNGFMLANAQKEVDDAVRVELQKAGPGAIVDPDAKQAILTMVYAIYGGAMALGAVFIFLGVIIKKFPLPITILSLVLYLAGTAVFAVLNWTTLLSGIIFKVFVVIALVRAIKAAKAYQDEVADEAYGELAS